MTYRSCSIKQNTYAFLAQLVEQLIPNQQVGSSSLSGRAFYQYKTVAPLLKLVLTEAFYSLGPLYVRFYVIQNGHAYFLDIGYTSCLGSP